MARICADCNRNLPQTSYTANQWPKGQGLSRCAGCVHGHYTDNSQTQHADSGRYNHASYARYTCDALEYPFASSAFRWVAKGTYNRGARKGQACVAKWFKTGAVFEADYFALDIKAVDKALEIVNRFNQLNILDKTVKINVPAVWTFDEDDEDDADSWAGQKFLCEPFIQNYRKFNSNTGWKDNRHAWAQAMQALSHFSYHISGGNYVLCDLQGGIYQHELVLSDPVVFSRSRDYGVNRRCNAWAQLDDSALSHLAQNQNNKKKIMTLQPR